MINRNLYDHSGFFSVFYLLMLFLISIIFIGCAVHPRQPCITEGRIYGIPDDQITRYDWDSCYRSGLSYSQGKCWDQAIAQFLKAIKKEPHDKWMARRYGMHFMDYFPHRELGIVYLHKGHIQEAIQELILSMATAESGKAKYYLNKARNIWLQETGLDQIPPQIQFFDQNNIVDEVIFTNISTYQLKCKVTDDFFVFKIFINDEPIFIDLAKPEVLIEKQVILTPGQNTFNCIASDLIDQKISQQIRIFLDQQGPTVFLIPAYNEIHSQKHAIGAIKVRGLLFDVGGVDTLKIAEKEISIIKGEKIQEFEEYIPFSSKATFFTTDLAGNITEGDLEWIWDNEKDIELKAFKPRIPDGFAHLKGIKLCYNGPLPPFSLSKNVKSESDKNLDIFIEDPPPVVFEPFVIISGYVESSAKILNVWINDTSILSDIEIPGFVHLVKRFFSSIQEILYGGRMRFYFTRKVPLEKGESYITIRAEDERGMSSPESIRVEYQIREIEKIGNRWQLAILPFAKQRMQQRFFDLPLPTSLDSIYYSLYKSFFDTKRFNLLERDQAHAIMRELGLRDGNIVDDTTGAKIGKILDAEVVLLGLMQEVWDGEDRCLEIQARLVDAETTEILGMNSVYNRWQTRKDARYLGNSLAQMFVEDFPLLQGEIIEKHRDTFEMNLCIEDLIKKGMKVLVYRFENEDQIDEGEKREREERAYIREGKDKKGNRKDKKRKYIDNIEKITNKTGMKKDKAEKREGKPGEKMEYIVGEALVKVVVKDYSLALPRPEELIERIRVGDFVITK